MIQVPSVCESNEDISVDFISSKNLSQFQKSIPTFAFIGEKKLIPSDIQYEVDEDVQLVCKYLQALEMDKERPRRGINRLFMGKIWYWVATTL